MKEIKLILQLTTQLQIDKDKTIKETKEMIQSAFEPVLNHTILKGNFHLFVREYEITGLESSNLIRTLDYYNSNVLIVVPETSLEDNKERDRDFSSYSTRDRFYKSNKNNLLNSSFVESDPLIRSNIDEAYKNLENLKKTLNKTFHPDIKSDAGLNLLDLSHKEDSLNSGKNYYTSKHNLSSYLLTDKNTPYYNNNLNENKILKEENENIFLTNQILNKSNIDLKTQLKNSLMELEAYKHKKTKVNELATCIQSLKQDLAIANKTNDELIRLYEQLENRVNELTEENKNLRNQLEGISMNYTISEKTNQELKTNMDTLEEVYRNFEKEKNILSIHLNEKEKQLEEKNSKLLLADELNLNLRKSIKDYEDMLENMKRTIEIISHSSSKYEEEVYKLRLTMQDREALLQGKFSENEKLKMEISKLIEDKNYLHNEIKCYKSEILKKESNLSDLLEANNKTKEDVQNYIDKIANLNKILEEKDNTLEKLKESYKTLNSTLEELKSENDLNKKLLSDEKIELNKANKGLMETETVSKALKSKNEELQNENKRLDDMLRTLEEKYKNLIESRNNMKKTFDNSLAEMRRNLSSLNDSEERLTKENEDLQKNFNEVKQERDSLYKSNKENETKLDQLNILYHKLNEECADIRMKIPVYENNIASLSKEAEKLNSDNKVLNTNIIEVTNKCNELQRLNTKLNAENMIFKEKCDKLNTSMVEMLRTQQDRNKFTDNSIINILNTDNNNYSYRLGTVENKSIIGTESIINLGQDNPKSVVKPDNEGLSPLKENKEKVFADNKIKIDDSNLPITNTGPLRSNSIKTEITEGSKFIFRIYDSKRVLRFDLENKTFKVLEFADFGDFDSNFIAEGSIYLNVHDGLFIVTGDNHDILYHFSHKKMTVSKITRFNDNHSHGGLVLDEVGRSLVCLSGWHNRKVEKYTNSDLLKPHLQPEAISFKIKSGLSHLPEMNVERSECAYVILNNRHLYSFFGYCCPKAKYLDTIEFLDLSAENSKWVTFKYSNEQHLSTHIKSHSLVKVNDRDLLIIGGVDGMKEIPIENFIKFDLVEHKIQASDRKLPDIIFNHSYNFQKDSQFVPFVDNNFRLHVASIDEMDNVHVIEVKSLQYDIFKFE